MVVKNAVRESLLINGEWVDGDSEIKVINPANTEEIVGYIAKGGESHVDKAVKAAKDAFPVWSSLPIQERADIVAKMGKLMLQKMPQRAELLTRENGKYLGESFIDFGFSAHLVEYFSQIANSLEEKLAIEDELGQAYLLRKPKGVIAAIVPWNTPIVLSFFKILPALIAGNTIVIKPATTVPLALIDTLRDFNELLPPGVLNIITGPGQEVGSYLTKHPDVSMVAFTGSIEAGKDVMRNASGSLKKVLLELGGNDPAIILDDFDINNDQLMYRMIRGVFNQTGQICFGLKRIYAPENVYDRFVQRFTEMADTLLVGNGLNPNVTLGPLNNEAGLNYIKELVNESSLLGAKVASVGQVEHEDIFKQGYFYRPTIVSDIDNSARLVQVEQFGPVIPIVKYNKLDDAIQMANNTVFGLGSSIWTSDHSNGFNIGRKLAAGQTFINSHEPFSLDPQLPFGGVKESGIGRAMSPFGLDEYVDYQTISNRYQQPGKH